jgi:hypothetical protein
MLRSRRSGGVKGLVGVRRSVDVWESEEVRGLVGLSDCVATPSTSPCSSSSTFFARLSAHSLPYTPLWAGTHCKVTVAPSRAWRTSICLRMYRTTYCSCGLVPSVIWRIACLLSVAMKVFVGRGLLLAWYARTASIAMSSATVGSPAAHLGSRF